MSETRTEEKSEVKVEQHGLLDMIPPCCNRENGGHTLITGYRIINVGDFIPNYDDAVTDFYSTRVIIVIREIEYPALESNWDFTSNDRVMSAQFHEKMVKKEGAWLLFYQACDPEREAEVKQELSTYCAMYFCKFGKQIAFKKEFQFREGEGKKTFDTNVMLHPSILKPVGL